MDYRKEILHYIENKNFEKVEELAKSAFDSEPENENLLAFVAGIIFENQVFSCFHVVGEFVKRFPCSLYPIRVYFAEILIRQQLYDEGSTEARIYLRIAQESNQFEKPHHEIITLNIGRAFYFLTGVYTEVGAKDYSKRILQYAQPIVAAYWGEQYAEEIKTLDNELRDEKAIELNNKWEDFFSHGAHVKELHDLCIEKKFFDLAKRVELLEGHFRFDASFKIDTTEILKLMYESEKNAFLLQ